MNAAPVNAIPSKSIKIATWNVNSIKARLPNVLAWLKEFAPDVVLMQEIKCTDESLPCLEIEELGYNIASHGQKSYNGVAILSKSPIEDVERGLPDLGGLRGTESTAADEQARYIEATVFGKVRVASLYLPNGNPIGTEKFAYKLSWMERLKAHMRRTVLDDELRVYGGDYNVIPSDSDVYNPHAFANDALTQPESRKAFRAMQYLGLTDALRAFNTAPHQYSYWDYQAGAWQKDHGLLIDFIMLTPCAADALRASGIDKGPRGKEKASDHTPVWCELAI
jgi:exodeoxyribonuclease-3